MQSKIILLLSLVLVSCATPSHYYQSPEAGASAPSLTNSSQRKGIDQFTRFTVTYIDNAQVSYRRPWFDPFKNMDTISVAPGQHKIIIKSEFDRKDSDCPCTALAELSFTAEAGVAYRVQGEVLENSVAFWIEEQDSGKVITDKATAEIIKLQYSSPITIVY